MSQQKNICNQKKAICYSLLNHCANIIEKFIGFVQKSLQKVEIQQKRHVTYSFKMFLHLQNQAVVLDCRH